MKAETTLFRLRFESDDAQEKERFLKALDLDWEPVCIMSQTPLVGSHVVLTETLSFTKVSHEEKKIHRSALIAAHPKLANNFDAEAYYKVPWTKVLDLVEKRKVYLHRGIAWVPMREQASLVVAEFSSRLSKDLEVFV